MTSFGFPRKMLENEKKDCYRCGKLGHLAVDCPSRPRIFSWKCTKCSTESTKYGCTVRKCMKTIVRVSSITPKNMFQKFSPEDIKTVFGKEVDSWLNLEPTIKLAEPTVAQIMLA